MSDSPLSLLNVFEVELGGTIRHLLCFIDPVLAGARGIDGRAVLGEFTPGSDGEFDPKTFQPNPQFVAGFEQFMNEVAAQSAELGNEARKHPSGRLNIVDARYRGTHGDPPSIDLVGSFTIDETGRIVPGSFRHNPEHAWFNPDTGASSILVNRQFYDWLHSPAKA